MSKYTYHTEPIGIDTSVFLNYDMKVLMQGIAQELSTISWAVMGKEVNGAVFVSVDPDDNDKLVTHASMVKADYNGEALSPDSYLWVVIDQIDDAYRARFLTSECVATLAKEDISPPAPSPVAQYAMNMAKALVDEVRRRSFRKGFAWGVIGTVIMSALIATLVAVIF